MKNKLVSIRMPELLLKSAEKISKEGGFSNMQDFIREAIREKVKASALERSIAELNTLRGSAKGSRPATKKELDEHIRKEFR